MTLVDHRMYQVIERNGTETPRFKKVYLIDLDVVDADGFVV